MKEILEISHDLCQLLQRKSQDILNAMDLLKSTKVQIQLLRDAGWEQFIEKVKLFCQKEELNNRFNETTNELLVLCVALDLKDGYKMFNVESICRLVETFYSEDFMDNEKEILEIQLRHYKEDITNHPEFKNISIISELCQTLVRTGKSTIYPLIDRLIRLVLTLPVFTTTVERLFSAMNHIKTDDRNKMDDRFLSDSLIIYIEREIVENISTDSIIEDFDRIKGRRVPLR